MGFPGDLVKGKLEDLREEKLGMEVLRERWE